MSSTETVIDVGPGSECSRIERFESHRQVTQRIVAIFGDQ